MAEITRERQGEIQKWVLKFLIDAGETLPARTTIKQVEENMQLTPLEKRASPNRPGGRRFEKIARFNTISLVKAGWLKKSKGRWAITDEGKKAYEDFADPVKLSLEASRLYREWKANQPDKEEEDEEDTPTAVSALEEAEESAWTEIQEYLGNMPPYEFQDLVAALLKAMGYYVSWVAPPGKDAGIDILAHNDPLGTNPPRIKVQVKRKADKVAVDGLRSFLAVLGDEDVGIFVSLGGFTSDAESEARTQEKRRVTLLDMEKLFDLWVEHYDDVEETEKRLLPLRPIYFLEPNI
jgi:restriction system protein